LLESLPTKRKTRRKKEQPSFFDRIKEGPSYICYSCGGLWFKNNVRLLVKRDNQIIMRLSQLNNVFEKEEKKYLCTTCRKAINKNMVPKLCLLNGLQFPSQPEILQDLNKLEERLISPRLPFLQIRELGEYF
jgi:DNA-directed RNA polymerase subunit RPC12/RpoP